jgi:ribosomal protein L40E
LNSRVWGIIIALEENGLPERGSRMATFDDVVDKAKDFAETAGKKAERVVEISRLKLQVSQINSDIRRAYEKLGSAVYNMKKANYEDADLISSVVEEIDGLVEDRASTEAKLAALKNQVVCDTCGAKNPQEAVYCVKCGSRLMDAEG